jgi:hypothetical protein
MMQAMICIYRIMFYYFCEFLGPDTAGSLKMLPLCSVLLCVKQGCGIYIQNPQIYVPWRSYEYALLQI